MRERVTSRPFRKLRQTDRPTNWPIDRKIKGSWVSYTSNKEFETTRGDGKINNNLDLIKCFKNNIARSLSLLPNLLPYCYSLRGISLMTPCILQKNDTSKGCSIYNPYPNSCPNQYQHVSWDIMNIRPPNGGEWRKCVNFASKFYMHTYVLLKHCLTREQLTI